ncbi:MAG: porin [Acetobacterales bacterium]
MKKLLLTTTALAGVSVLAAGAASAAEAPNANLRGYYSFFFTHTDEDADTATTDFADSAYYADYEFHVRARGKADNGLEYGAKYEVDPSESNVRDEAAMYIQHANFGTLELGNDDGVAANMSVSLPRGFGTGGADGAYDEVVRGGPQGPKLVGNDMSLGDSSKISYYSPKFAGFDFGISYQFTNDEGEDTRNNRNILQNTAATATNQESAIQMNLRYTGEFAGVGVKTNLAYASIQMQDALIGAVQTDRYEDPTGLQFGLSLDWGAWTVGGGYIQWEDVLRSHATPIAADNTLRGADDATAFNAGIQYKMGPWTIGANYMAEEAEGSQTIVGTVETEAYAVGARYALAPGLRLDGEVIFFDAQGEDPTVNNDNDGTVLMVGTTFSF